MVKHTLIINIDQKWVDYYNKLEYSTCFARNCQSDGRSLAIANVIAVADDVKNTLTITWTDEYAIAASTYGFTAGSLTTASTPVVPIRFAQSGSLTDWARFSVQDDKRAPTNGFLFDTTPRSAAVLFQTIDRKVYPIFTTPDTLLPPDSLEPLIPLASVSVWFQRDVSSGTMVDAKSTKPFVVDMTSDVMTVHYDKDGKWHSVTQPVDYTNGRAETYHATLDAQSQNGVSGNLPSQNGATQQKVLEYR